MATDDGNLEIELGRKLSDLTGRIQALEKPLQIGEKERRLEDLDQMAQDPDFWSDQDRASAVQQERSHLVKTITAFRDVSNGLSDSTEFVQMAEGDTDTLAMVQSELETYQAAIEKMEFQRMFTGEQDGNNAILELSVGQGGVDAADFTEMLLRMYVRYGEKNGFDVELIDKQHADEAGLKSATLMVKGPYAYGNLKSETGVHRLVRISPFDSNARRHTSFSAVFVIPEVDDSIEIDIKKDDLRIDTMRAGGAGGQHVNKTESAVRFTHIPTGIVVTCAQERSQLKNRNLAMKLLKAKLYEHEMRQKLAEKDKNEAQKLEASFGSQIRNYVQAPYRLVKDLRSGHESSAVDAVLDGDLQPFVEAYLYHLEAEQNENE